MANLEENGNPTGRYHLCVLLLLIFAGFHGSPVLMQVCEN